MLDNVLFKFFLGIIHNVHSTLVGQVPQWEVLLLFTQSAARFMNCSSSRG